MLLRLCFLFLCLLLPTTTFADAGSNVDQNHENAKHLIELWLTTAGTKSSLLPDVNGLDQKYLSQLVKKEVDELFRKNFWINFSDPNRAEIEARIREKIEPLVRKDIQSAFTKSIETTRTNIATAQNDFALMYEVSIEPSGIQFLLDFYQSSHGKRYFQFAEKLGAIELSCQKTLAYLTERNKPLARQSNINEAVIENRINLIKKGLGFRLLEEKYRADKEALKDTSGYAAIDFMNVACAMIQGDKLDDLYKTYTPDINAFEEYLVSDYSKQEMSLWIQIAQRMGENLQAEIMSNLESYRSGWKHEIDRQLYAITNCSEPC